MRSTRWPGFVLGCTLLCLIATISGAASARAAMAEAADPPRPVPLEGEVTLTRAATENTFGFTTAAFGKVERDGTVFNLNSQIAFDGYKRDHLSVSVQGGERASIHAVTDEKLAGRKLFDRITMKDNQILVAGKSVLAIDAPDHKTKHAAPTAGRVFVIRIDGNAVANQKVEKDATFYVRVVVLEFLPGTSVTIRWALL